MGNVSHSGNPCFGTQIGAVCTLKPIVPIMGPLLGYIIYFLGSTRVAFPGMSPEVAWGHSRGIAIATTRGPVFRAAPLVKVLLNRRRGTCRASFRRKQKGIGECWGSEARLS